MDAELLKAFFKTLLVMGKNALTTWQSDAWPWHSCWKRASP